MISEQYSESFKSELLAMRASLINDLIGYLINSTQEDEFKVGLALKRLSTDEQIDVLLNLLPHAFDEQMHKLQMIDAALSQFEMGLYGVCADCEDHISVEELQKTPYLQRCKHCR